MPTNGLSLSDVVIISEGSGSSGVHLWWGNVNWGEPSLKCTQNKRMAYRDVLDILYEREPLKQ